MPVYNTEKYLIECLDSICNQTLKEIEIILVDDGSTDGSLSILEEYAKKDTRIQILENEKKGSGAGGARNTGLKKARGSYLSFLDSDDHFDLYMLEIMYERSERLQTDITLCDAVAINYETKLFLHTLVSQKSKEKFLQHEVFDAGMLNGSILYDIPHVTWLNLYRRDFIIEEKLEFQSVKCHNDIVFVKLAAALAKSMTFCDTPLVYYKKHRPQSLQTALQGKMAFIDAFSGLRAALEEKNILDCNQNGFANLLLDHFHWILQEQAAIDMAKWKETFALIADRYIKEFELDTFLTENLMPYDMDRWLTQIKNKDQVGYLFDLLEVKKKAVFCFESEVVFPYDQIKKDDKVILYGAGNIGTGFYLQNQNAKHCTIVAWVDQNPEDKQIPVQGLYALETVACDKVIVAIDSESIFQEVRRYLLEIGFKADQIIYGV